MNPVWKLKKILFNLKDYGEFLSGITPYAIISMEAILVVIVW
jgi:hypothetical protein